MAVKVLIADDEKIIRDFFARLLGLKGYEVTTAKDGYEAIKEVKKSSFNVIFLDVRMPGLDGLETLREIRKIDKDVPVVMITGFAVEEVLKEAEKEGAYSSIKKPFEIGDSVKKPFEIGEIKVVIDRALDSKRGGALNLLVVDDEKAVLDFFIRALRGKNYELKVVKSEREAIEAVNRQSFDLVFLDVTIPEIDGISTYRAIKKALPETEIVTMTGYRDEKLEDLEDIEEVLKLGATGCLYKPSEIEKIIKKLEETRSKKEG